MRTNDANGNGVQDEVAFPEMECQLACAYIQK